MAANLEEQLINKVRALPPNKRLAALRLLDRLVSESNSAPHETGANRRQIWEVVEEINQELPEDAWDNVPTDGSINLDHYLTKAIVSQTVFR